MRKRSTKSTKPPKPTKNQTRREAPELGEQRLQKVLAAAGLGSRRKCEELITQGRVEVDRQVVTELGTRVDPQTQEVRVDGSAIRQQRMVYFIVNKPSGVLSTNYDPEYRTRVVDLVAANERLFTVGRLDQFSEGLILVTNDGQLANRLMHPRYGAEKTYQLVVAGQIEPATIARLRKGVHLAEGFARVASLTVRKERPHSSDLEMVLREGKNRELRRIFAAVGHKVLKLRRTQIGPLKLGELPVGAHRTLSKAELDKLFDYAYSKRRPEPKQQRPASERARPDDEGLAPLIDESEEALGSAEEAMPLLVDDSAYFEETGEGSQAFRPQRPGAVIAFDDDDQVAPRKTKTHAAPYDAQRIPRPRGPKKKFAKKKSAGGRAGDGKAGRGKASDSKPSGGKARYVKTSAGAKSGAAKKFTKKPTNKKPAHKKGR